MRHLDCRSYLFTAEAERAGCNAQELKSLSKRKPQPPLTSPKPLQKAARCVTQCCWGMPVPSRAAMHTGELPPSPAQPSILPALRATYGKSLWVAGHATSHPTAPHHARRPQHISSERAEQHLRNLFSHSETHCCFLG